MKFGQLPKLIGPVIKIFLLSIFTALFVFMAYLAFLGKQPVMGTVIAAITLIINYVFLSRRFVAAKFLVPSAILMVLFVITPIVYTVVMSTFHYGTGNEISKSEAIQSLKLAGQVPDDSGETYDMVLGTFNGKDAALLTDQINGQVSIATTEKVTPLKPGTYKADSAGVATGYQGFVKWDDNKLAQSDTLITELAFPLDKKHLILPQDTATAALMLQTYSFNADETVLKDTYNNITYRDNGNGNFVATDGTVLYPGWQAFNPGLNYASLFTNPRISGPFIQVFIWTILFALSTVVIMFFAGLALALALEKKIKFRNFYRSVLILPYAIPSFMSLLIWHGMFNRQFGAVNHLFNTQIDWYNDPILAKFVILLVNLWLGFPYFYLISTGALAALPTDVIEAAEIDGATGGQIFRQIKLPLLLQVLSPLLIASFAFNFNNFNLIYLLTGGGPTNVLAGETAGATDILITYAYKTAFGGETQDFGLASAISVIMFVIVGALSMWSLRRSKVMEEL